VPALALDLGRRIWWPSRLGRVEPDLPPVALPGSTLPGGDTVDGDAVVQV
jgi:hypothetical protein